jgi:hypothetical protein
LAREWIPGLDAVRSGASLRVGVALVSSLLAGCGVAVLSAGRSRQVRRSIVAALSLLWLGETFVQAAAMRSVGHRTDMIARPVRPPEETVRLYAGTGDAPVLDLPLSGRGIAGYLSQASDYLLLHSYHRAPVAACNNSFISGVQHRLRTMVDLFSERPWKLDAFQALGFRTLFVHRERLRPEERDKVAALLERLEQPRDGHAYLAPSGSDATRARYAIFGAVPTHSDAALLEVIVADPLQKVGGGAATLAISVRNPSALAFVQEPLRPIDWLIRHRRSPAEPRRRLQRHRFVRRDAGGRIGAVRGAGDGARKRR